MRNVRTISIVAVLFGSATLAAAQEPTEGSFASVLTVGSRVRVLSTAVQGRLRGVVVAIDETVLTLAPDDRALVKVPVRSITQADLSLGRKRNTLKGLVIGGVSFAALGLTFSVDPEDCGPESLKFCSRGEAVSGGALVGVLLGTGIGALIESERWAPMTIGLRTPAAARRGDRAIEVALSIRF